MTADGKIATANRAVHSFGSERDLEHLYELRATADAVMCGARTVEISQSILGTGGEKFRKLRLKRGLAEYNLRVIVSGSGSINPRAAIFKKHFSPVIILTTGTRFKNETPKSADDRGRSEGLRQARNQFRGRLALAAGEMGREAIALRRRRRVERRPVPRRLGG